MNLISKSISDTHTIMSNDVGDSDTIRRRTNVDDSESQREQLVNNVDARDRTAIETLTKNTNNTCNTEHSSKMTHLNNNNDYKNGVPKINGSVSAVDENKEKFVPKLRWPDLIAQIFLHAGAVYGFIFQFYRIKLFTFFWCKYLKR